MVFNKLAFAMLIISPFFGHNLFAFCTGKGETDFNYEYFNDKNEKMKTVLCLKDLDKKAWNAEMTEAKDPAKYSGFIEKKLILAKKKYLEGMEKIHPAFRDNLMTQSGKCFINNTNKIPFSEGKCFSEQAKTSAQRLREIASKVQEGQSLNNLDAKDIEEALKKHCKKNEKDCILENIQVMAGHLESASNLFEQSISHSLMAEAAHYQCAPNKDVAPSPLDNCNTPFSKTIKKLCPKATEFTKLSEFIFSKEGSACQNIPKFTPTLADGPSVVQENLAAAAKLKAQKKGEKGNSDESNNAPGSGGNDKLSFKDKKQDEKNGSKDGSKEKKTGGAGEKGGGLGTSQYGNNCPIRKSEHYCGTEPSQEGIKDLASKGPVALASEKKCLGAMVGKFVNYKIEGIVGGVYEPIIKYIDMGNYKEARELIKNHTEIENDKNAILDGLTAIEVMSKQQEPRAQSPCNYIQNNSAIFNDNVVNIARARDKKGPEIAFPPIMDVVGAVGSVLGESTKQDLGVFDLELKGQGLIDLAIQAGVESQEVISNLLDSKSDGSFCANRSKVDEESNRKLNKKLSEYAKKRLAEFNAKKETANSLKIKDYDILKMAASDINLAEEGLKNAFVAHEHACYDKSPLKRDFVALGETLASLKEKDPAKRKKIVMPESHAELCNKAKELIKNFTDERNKRFNEQPLLMTFAKVNGTSTKSDYSCDSIQKSASKSWTEFRTRLGSLGGSGIGGKSDINPLNMARSYFGLNKEFCENSTNYADALYAHKAQDDNSKIAMINKMVKDGYELVFKKVQNTCNDGLVKMGARLAAPSNNAFLENYLKCDGMEEESVECQNRRTQSLGLCYLQIDEKDGADKKETATILAMTGMMGLGVLGAGTSVVAALAALGLDIGAVGLNHFMEDRIAHDRIITDGILSPKLTSVTPEQFADALNESSEAGERLYKAQGALDVLFGLADLAALKMAVNAYKEGKVATELVSVLKKDEKAFQRAQQYPHYMTISEKRERAIYDFVKGDKQIAEADKARKIEEMIAIDKLQMKELSPQIEKKLKESLKDHLTSRLTKWSKTDLGKYFEYVDKMDLDTLDRLNNLELKAIEMAKKQPGFVEKIKGIMARLHERLRDSFKKNPNCFKV